MEAASKSTAAESNTLSLWQRRLGLLAVLLTLPLMSAIIVAGAGLHDLLRYHNVISILPMTEILMATGYFLNSYWYAVAAVFVGVYFFWFSKKTIRLLWFNAAVSVVLLLAVGVSMDTYFSQQRLIQKVRREHPERR